MKTKILIMSLILIMGINNLYSQASNTEKNISERDIKGAIGKTSMLFIENKGQVKDNNGNSRAEVLFYLTRSNSTVYFQKDRISVVLHKRESDNEGKLLRYDMVFSNSNAEKKIYGADEQTTKFNFLKGNNNQWITGARTYSKIVYENIYPNIDLVFYCNATGLKYDFIVRPNGNPNNIHLKYDGVKSIEQVSATELKIRTSLGDLTERLPEGFEIPSGAGKKTKKKIECEYKIEGTEVSFKLGKYEPLSTVVIDPELLSSAFLAAQYNEITGWLYNQPYQTNGSSLEYFGGGVCYDPYSSNETDGDYFIFVGSTHSNEFLAEIGEQSTTSIGLNLAMWDAFVAKYRVKDGTLVWVTEFGGSMDDFATDVIVRDDGRIIIVGSTQSIDFPLFGLPLQMTLAGGTDVFIAVINMSSAQPPMEFEWSTYWGGTNDDFCHSVDLDYWGNIYIVGETTSGNFPVFPPPPYQQCNSCPAEPDAFVCKFNYDLSTFIWGRFIGGNRIDNGLGINVDKGDNIYLNKIYVTGATNSNIDFPLFDPVQNLLNGNGLPSNTRDAFVSILNMLTGYYEFSTYLGGSDEDFGTGIGSIINDTLFVVTGFTKSDTSEGFPLGRFPLPITELDNGAATNAGDGFVAYFKLDEQTNTFFIYNTFYLGGSNEDRANDLTIGKDLSINIVGYTKSEDFPLFNSFQHKINGTGVGNAFDAFYYKFLPLGPKLWSTYYGGIGDDYGSGIAITLSDLSYPLDLYSKKVNSINDGVSVIGGITNFGPYYLGYEPLDDFITAFSSLSIFPTLFGGNLYDEIRDAATDQDGYIYITGVTTSTNLSFPVTSGVVQTQLRGNSDAFVAKFNNVGYLQFCTYFGGNGEDWGNSIAVLDNNQDIFIAGGTKSTNLYNLFPPQQGYYCYQATLGDQQDGFLARISPNGDAARFVTYYGGVGNPQVPNDGADEVKSIFLANDGILLTGYASANLTMQNGYDLTFNGGTRDAFIAKFYLNGNLQWSSYLGGSGDECGNGITTINNINTGFTNIAITGWTTSSNYPTTYNAYQSQNQGGTDAFVTMLNNNGNQLLYSTYFGGPEEDTATAITHPRYWDNNVFFITGHTRSNNMSFGSNSQLADQEYDGEFDAFAAKFLCLGNPDEWVLSRSSYVGNGGSNSMGYNDFAYDIITTPYENSSSSVYVVGKTKTQAPDVFWNSYRNVYNTPTCFDGFIYNFNKNLSAPASEIFGTTIGGPRVDNSDQDDWANAVVLDRFNQPIVVGGTTSAQLGKDGNDSPNQNNNNGGTDGFIIKLNFDLTYLKREVEPDFETILPTAILESNCIELIKSSLGNNSTLSILSETEGDATLSVFNLLGQMLHSSTLSLRKGENEFTLPIPQIPEGLYLVRIQFQDCFIIFGLKAW